MNYEFGEVARDAAEQVGAELDRIERHGGGVGEVEEAFAPLDDVIGQLEAALSEAKSLKADLDGRAEEVRDGIEEAFLKATIAVASARLREV